ncbi:sterol carrier family protein [Microlunatus speluncae]|uniref:sterol carrier family protein n=1 Tax=Microlunatus speluncae TaxID=2594267 RepID=UPI0013761C3F|nr:sterol carrier family protein [Microlunatus speluncae]
MVGPKPQPEQHLLAQSRIVRDWLTALPAEAFAAPTVLESWDVRTLTGHLVGVHTRLTEALRQPTRQPAVPVHELVRRYRHDAAMIMDWTERLTGDHSGPELVRQLSAAIDELAEALSPEAPRPKVIMTPRGPGRTADFIATRILDLVVHADDLSRSWPGRPAIEQHRPALAHCTRTLAAILAAQQPGRSIEVRVPPFAAVQCGIGEPGPTHTRGTPPNVVETDPVTFLRLATGRISWAEAREAGAVTASGQRADLSPALPVLS